MKLKEYWKGHLYHADGSLYMGRYGIFETHWLSIRIHHIATADNDRVLHDHPWNFLSLVLKGGYIEERPYADIPCWDDEKEMTYRVTRKRWSFGFRRATSRHRVSFVEPDTWTLFIYGRLRQPWGFITQHGKIFWRRYLETTDVWHKDNNRVEGEMP
jgi:hypothetical protein